MDHPERAVNGRGLYEATVSLGYQFYFWKPWDELPWNERDEWEARADELNEARRPL